MMFYRRIFLGAIFPTVFAFILLISVSSSPAHSAPPPPEPTPVQRRLPDNQPARGIFYDGLEYDDNFCPGAFKLKNSFRCTHGPDPAPLGIDPRADAPVIATKAPVAISAAQCDGDGSSGYRTQVMYVRPSDRADRYATYASSIQTWAAGADSIYKDSAAETGGYRRLRFVHDGSCNIIVLNVVIPGTGTVDFGTMTSQLSALGYNRTDRKYMIFFDLNYYCGIGNIYPDDSPGQSNINNTQVWGTMYARADTGCWSGGTIAHESMHNMGAVQRSAPHSTYLQNTSSGNTWHCSDEYDRMCYSDATGVVMTYPCASSSHDNIFDCNHDDYFNTNPAPGSYLATKWNSANNRFLITTTPLSLPLTPRLYLPLVIK